MPDPIPPAMTSEEWARWRSGDRYPLRRAPFGHPYIIPPDPDDDDPEVLVDGRFTGDTIPALMALANAALPDGHPGKLTREDVELVQALAHGWPPDSPEGQRILSLAAKLTALLPPDEPTA